MENLGTIVNLVEARSTLSRETGALHAGNTLNSSGEEKLVWVLVPPDVSQEVSDFYAR